MNPGVLHHRTSLGHLSSQGSPSLSRQIIFIWPSIDLIIQPFYWWALVLLKFSELEVGDSMMMLFLVRSYFTEPRVELHLFIQFSSVQSLSCVWLFATPWSAACQASLSITSSRSLLKLMSIVSGKLGLGEITWLVQCEIQAGSSYLWVQSKNMNEAVHFLFIASKPSILTRGWARNMQRV